MSFSFLLNDFSFFCSGVCFVFVVLRSLVIFLIFVLFVVFVIINILWLYIMRELLKIIFIWLLSFILFGMVLIYFLIVFDLLVSIFLLIFKELFLNKWLFVGMKLLVFKIMMLFGISLCVWIFCLELLWIILVIGVDIFCNVLSEFFVFFVWIMLIIELIISIKKIISDLIILFKINCIKVVMIKIIIIGFLNVFRKSF